VGHLRLQRLQSVSMRTEPILSRGWQHLLIAAKQPFWNERPQSLA
jgi:hypothetical protein